MASARELGLAELDAGSIGRSHPINPSITTFSDFIEPGVSSAPCSGQETRPIAAGIPSA